MRLTRHVKVYVVVCGAVLLAGACAAGRRVPYSEVPVPPAAREDQPEGPQEVEIDLAADAIHHSVRDEFGRPKTAIYTLPDDSTWESVLQFYAGKLGSDWRAEPRMSKQTGYFKMAGWTRGGTADRQALVIAYLPQPGGVRRRYLLLALAPE